MAARYTQLQAEQLNYPVLVPVDADLGLMPVALDKAVCVVGARARVHLPLDKAEVSKAQALLICEADGVYVRDLASRNRTYVNSQAVREARLELGDVVQFGTVAFQCQSGFDREVHDDAFSAAELWLQADGMSSRQLMPMEHRTFLIGTRRSCDLQLKGAKISLPHAVIFLRNGKRYLRDLDSLTGTFVNNQTIREVELRDGDSIRILTTTIEYHAGLAALPMATPQPREERAVAQLSELEATRYDEEVEQNVFLADDAIRFAGLSS